MDLAWAVHCCPSTAVNQDFTELPWELLGKHWFHFRETFPQSHLFSVNRCLVSSLSLY